MKNKLLLIATIVALLVVTVNAFQIDLSDVRAFLGMGKIPQFILDFNNPWIKKNQGWLKRRKDLAHELCDLDSPLRNGGISGRVYPEDLFHHLKIGGDSGQVWDNVLNRLEEINACPAALNDVKHLKVNICIHSTNATPDDPGEEITELFANTLSAMPSLERLDWGIPVDSVPFFETAFTQHSLSLPSVKYLVPGAFSQYMLAMCPNLEGLAGGTYYDHYTWNHYDHEREPVPLLLDAAAQIPTLNTLKIGSTPGSFNPRTYWNNEMTRRIVRDIPNLTSLTITGNIKDSDRVSDRLDYGWPEDADEDGVEYGIQLKAILHELKGSTGLRHLTLPDASGLDFGFDGGSGCGNSYFGPQGRAYGREITKASALISERAGNITISILPNLDSLEIAWPATITRNDDGTASVSWPWTGRMEEWLYEVWPEPEKGTPDYEL